MYPTGSNGATQAIADARALGANIRKNGLTLRALEQDDKELCEPISQLVQRNRGVGPFDLLNLLDERCGGKFDYIDNAIPEKEREEFVAKYKSADGFAIDTLNNAPSTIPASSSPHGR